VREAHAKSIFQTGSQSTRLFFLGVPSMKFYRPILKQAILLTALGLPFISIQAHAQMAAMEFRFNSPLISYSGLQGSSHLIRVAVMGMSLEDLNITLPPEMEAYQSLQVMDQQGNPIPAEIKRTGSQVNIAFEQPVAPGSYIQVRFNGLRMTTVGGATLLYAVTAKRTGIDAYIPVGTAIVEIPSPN
jgi:hypothetical protein